MTNTSALPVPQESKEIFPTKQDFSIAYHAWLNGSVGRNRTQHARAVQLIEADQDTDAIETWLDTKKAHSQNTQLSYRREAYRLLAWSIWFREKPVSSMTIADVSDFHSWLQQPQPHPEWIRRGWRFIRGPLDKSSARLAFKILSSMFRWLVEAGYLAGNPFRLFDQNLNEYNESDVTHTPVKHAFDNGLWEWIVRQIETYIPLNHNSDEYQTFERTRFALIFMYWTGLSGQEMLNLKMGQIIDEGEFWILEINSKKGLKPDRIVLLHPAIDALRRYRITRGLTELPSPREKLVSLVAAHRGKKSITLNYLNSLLKKLFSRLAEDARHIDIRWTEQLRSATSRWLRCTLIAHNAQAGVPIHNTTQQLRFKSVEIPRRIYQHIESLEKLNEGLEKLLSHNSHNENPSGNLIQGE